ncbi:MAG: AraC family transcriptional regulator [Solirubrobacteraceae bacterium]|nr:AraC family transcriptional regulator [Solirubrobacteraceae bacterium]
MPTDAPDRFPDLAVAPPAGAAPTLVSPQSFGAASALPSELLADGASLGWGSALVRRFSDPESTEGFDTPPSPDAMVCTNLSGTFTIESRRGDRWVRESYYPGAVGLTAPFRSSTLRWHESQAGPVRSLHVYLAAPLLDEIGRALGRPRVVEAFPDALRFDDPTTVAAMSALDGALTEGVGPLVGDTLAYGLAAHLLGGSDWAALRPRDPHGALAREDRNRIVDFMEAHLHEAITLDALAALVPMSKYHFLRSFSLSTGLTPHRYLRQLRLRRAAELLRRTEDPVARISVAVGYVNSAKFAAAFRAQHGASPSRYREAHRPSRRTPTPPVLVESEADRLESDAVAVAAPIAR